MSLPYLTVGLMFTGRRPGGVLGPLLSLSCMEDKTDFLRLMKHLILDIRYSSVPMVIGEGDTKTRNKITRLWPRPGRYL